MTEKVFKATFQTASKKFTVAVLAENAQDAKHDMASVVHAEFHLPFGMFRLSEVKKSNRRVLARMQEARTAKGWAWFS